ncbi:MAG TPA: shikimate dehydrogenase [Opitutaceae bacterium]|jgi:shikimate dehydrogenase|nr:shikimate dehydrogenase [Opitutaceae bacterium]
MSADPVHTLDDLVRWSHAGTSLAVLGHPIAHSLSPPMHNAALAGLAQRDARFRDWRYFRFDVPPADLPRALALLHEEKFYGLNLTVPHKVMAFDLVAETDPAAQPVGAVNTLTWTEHGWHGYNTDGYGLATAVYETLGRKLAGAHIIILGAGGAARGAAVECLQQRCASLWILNRTKEKLAPFLAILEPLKGNISVRGFALDAPPPNFPKGVIFIQATTLGLHASDTVPFKLRDLPDPAGVYDMTYNLSETALGAQARERNIPYANGLSMLVHQGAKSLEIWTGAPAAETAPVMRAAAEAALRDV